MLNFLGSQSYYVLSRIANYSSNYYFTNTKGSSSSWEFQTISLNTQEESYKIQYMSSFYQKNDGRVRCIRDSNNFTDNTLPIKGQPLSDIFIGHSYLLEVSQTNTVSCTWTFMEDGSNINGCSVRYSPNKVGKQDICVHVVGFAAGQRNKCFTVNAQIFEPSSDFINNDFAISEEDEIYEGLNAGKLLKYGGKIWLLNDFTIKKSRLKISHRCPSGFEPPNEELYNALFSSLGNEGYDFLAQKLNYSNEWHYMFNKKSGN